ncbi:MAG: hypothetical protein MJ252_17725 [archaeon]|nr:hypothetical protein [archaeon]
MKVKIILLLTITLISFTNESLEELGINNYDDAEDNLVPCGKEDPDGKNDCIKYGTDSDFYCCLFEPSNGKKFCRLVSYKAAGDGIGDKKFKLFASDPGDGPQEAICSHNYLKYGLIISTLCLLLLV